jgi:hypothetical protein
MAMPNLEPHDVAFLDQMLAAGNRDVDGLVALVREHLASGGQPVDAVAVTTGRLDLAALDPIHLATLLAIAVVRLAQHPGGESR